MGSEIFEQDHPGDLQPHERKNRSRQHDIFIFLAKTIRIYMVNYLRGYFNDFPVQENWRTRFKNISQAFENFNFESKESKTSLRKALHVRLTLYH